MFARIILCGPFFLEVLELLLYEVELRGGFLLESKVLGSLSKDKIIQNVFDDLPHEVE